MVVSDHPIADRPPVELSSFSDVRQLLHPLTLWQTEVQKPVSGKPENRRKSMTRLELKK